MSHFQQWAKASAAAAERSIMVKSEVRRTQEDQRKARAIEFAKQGVWTTWGLPEQE